MGGVPGIPHHLHVEDERLTEVERGELCSTQLRDEEASVAEGSLIDKMLKSALSPQPGAASPATCLLVLHEVEKKLLVRKSERIRKSLLKRHSQQHARAALQEITKCALGSKCAAMRADIAARPVKSTRFKVGNNGRRVI